MISYDAILNVITDALAAYVRKCCDESFQRGVERGRLEQRNNDAKVKKEVTTPKNNLTDDDAAQIAELEMSPGEVAAYMEWESKDGPKCGTLQPPTEKPREPTYTTTIREWRALKAHVAGLRRALDTARVELSWIIRNSEPLGTDSGDLSTNRAAKSCQAGIISALAEPPSVSLAKHDSDVLREVARMCEFHEAVGYPVIGQQLLLLRAAEIEAQAGRK